MKVRSSTPDYAGYFVAFSGPNIPRTSMYGGGSFKSGFKVSGTDWQEVTVPMKSFSYDWSAYTGRCDTKDPDRYGRAGVQHHCCSSAHPEVCPDAKYLDEISSIELWAEGVDGKFE